MARPARLLGAATLLLASASMARASSGFPTESELVGASFAVEEALREKLFAPARLAGASESGPGSGSTANGSDLGCFYSYIPGPEGNRIQALVASGKSIADMGNYDMCNHAEGTQYCTASVGFNNVTVTGFRIGLCVASNCTSDMVDAVIGGLLDELRPTIDPFLYLNNATVHCPEPTPPLNWASYVAFTLYSLLFVLCVAGTWLKWEPAKPAESSDTNQNDLAAPMLDVTRGADVDDKPKRKPGACEQVVMAFDVRTNFKKLMLPSVDDRLACLNGVRALSMFWIIYGHTFFNALQATFMNVLYMLPPDGYTAGYAFEMVPGGYFAVDAFFWLGGFLVVYHLLAEIKKKGRGPPIYILYIFRIVRIVPTYIFFLLFFAGVLKFIGDGPVWYLIDEHSSPCLSSWWSNLLFINNFYPIDESKVCMDWSWYLANDMQFFLITPFLIWTYHKSKVAGFAVCIVLLLASTGITAWLVIGGTKMPAGYTLPEDLSSSSLNPNNGYFVAEVYVKPYCRIQSYIIGIMTGYVNDIMVLRDSPKRKLPMWLDVVLTLVASTLCWVCVFGEQGQYSASPSPWALWQNVVYNSLSKIAFSVGLGLLCMMCVAGSARFVNWFLTWWAWNPIARLTFGAYLVHPMIMDLFYSSSRTTFYWSNYFMPVNFVFYVVAAYLCATAQFMLLERPIMSLTGLLKKRLGGSRRKKKRPQAVSEGGPFEDGPLAQDKDFGAQINVT